MIKLSIIIPMYNVAPYVERCIRSLENQDIPRDEYEIICVNDGSPDHCAEVVEKLQQEYPNIVLINQENMGVSMARNNAIQKAKGEYLLPIDPDDYVAPNTFRHITQKAYRHGCDVLYLGFEIFDADGNLEWKSDYSSKNDTLCNGIESYSIRDGKNRGPNPDRSWAIMYRKKMLDNYNIKYPKGIPYLEDGVFISLVSVVAKKVCFDQSEFYKRTTRSGSATHSNLPKSKKAIDGLIAGATILRDFQNQPFLTSEQKEFLNHPITKFVVTPVIMCVDKYSFRLLPYVRKKLKINKFNKLSLNGCTPFYRRQASFYNISIYYLYIRTVIRFIHT